MSPGARARHPAPGQVGGYQQGGDTSCHACFDHTIAALCAEEAAAAAS
ncbi:hypothetical protein [Kitasatospora purpeofusca]|nr:hypothetical protein OIP63_33040 [Kitasatospora purpeofusca]